MNAYHPLMLAELKKTAPAVNWVLELDHPTAGTLRMSVEGVASQSLGTYKPMLASLGDLSLTLSGWRGGLTAPTLSAELWDVAGYWTITFGVDLRKCAVRGILMSPNVPAAAYHTWFSGALDKLGQSNPAKLSGSMRMDDDTLAASFPRSEIKEAVFTSLPGETDLRGKCIPYLVGNHDSSGLAARGMLKLFYVGQVSSTAWRYLVATGWWPVVVRVLVAGVEAASPSEYVISRILTADARKVTVVDFLTDQGTAEVLADVQDLTSASGPGACLQRLATDVVWNDYHTDSFVLGSAPINTASITALDIHQATLGIGRSYYISPERVAGADIPREFCVSNDASAYWTAGGELAFIPWELRPQGTQLYLGPGSEDGTLATRQVLRDSDMLSGFLAFDADPQSAVTRISGKSGRRGSDGAWLNSRSVIISRGGVLERVRDIELPWLPATAESVGNVEYLIATGSSGVSNFTASAGTIQSVLAQGPPPGDPGLGTQFSLYVESATATAIGGGSAVMDIDLSDMPEVVAVANLGLWLTASSAPGFASSGDQDLLTAYWVIGGVQYPAGYPADGYEGVIGISGPKRFLIATPEVDPSTGLPWTRATITALKLRVIWTPSYLGGVVDGNKRVRVAQAYAVANYTAAANVSPSLLTVLSRLAHRYAKPPRIFNVEVPLRFLDYDIGDDIPVEDPRKGWGARPYQRGRLRVVGKRYMPSKNRGALTLEDVRPQLCTFHLLGRALGSVDGSSAAGDGMLLLTHGGAVSVARASPKYLDSPAGIDVQDAGPVVKIQNNCWPSERHGTLAERTATNALKRSSFVSSGTGLTPSAGSGTITFDATVGEQLFLDPIVTAQHLLLTAGAPHLVETRETWPASDAISSATIALSIDYKGSSLTANDAPAFRLVRSSDGFFLNAATRAFQAGAVDNRVPESLTWTRYKLVAATTSVKGGQTYTLSVSLPAGGTASRKARIGHVQLEGAEWGSSRIVTDAATVTRAADVITIANDKDGYYLWPDKRGAWFWIATSNWSSADVAAGARFYLSALTYDANNAWELYYLVGTGFIFKARGGGVDVTAVVNVPVVAGTEYTVRARFSSSMGENGTPYTLELIVSDGTTTTRAISGTYVPPVFVAGKVVAIAGHDVSPDVQWDGPVIEGRESPYCQTDAELGL